MEIIYRVKQIKELEQFTRKERRKLINKNRLNMYNHWQGWFGSLLFFLLFVIMMSSNYWLPSGLTLLNNILIMGTIGIIALAIKRVCELTTIAPYIRDEIELLSHKDLESSDKISEPEHLQGPVDKTPPGL